MIIMSQMFCQGVMLLHFKYLGKDSVVRAAVQQDESLAVLQQLHCCFSFRSGVLCFLAGWIQLAAVTPVACYCRAVIADVLSNVTAAQ
jgi:hypothetical protein